MHTYTHSHTYIVHTYRHSYIQTYLEVQGYLVISRVIAHIRGLIAPLITIHEPPSTYVHACMHWHGHESTHAREHRLKVVALVGASLSLSPLR